ncbi:uncharacterized protein LOC133789924 [Humulus lupulus]|uniref:uncharacterized protein LOC133789924 n=1 Tax=Humulus lupulus TaxID=3486 RepID=UPI002B408977|nr:uncharacterized protein LOC133789924 [Humulus lupulus]
MAFSVSSVFPKVVSFLSSLARQAKTARPSITFDEEEEQRPHEKTTIVEVDAVSIASKPGRCRLLEIGAKERQLVEAKEVAEVEVAKEGAHHIRLQLEAFIHLLKKCKQMWQQWICSQLKRLNGTCFSRTCVAFLNRPTLDIDFEEPAQDLILKNLFFFWKVVTIFIYFEDCLL